MKLNALLLYFGLVVTLCSVCQEGRADCNTAPTVPNVVELVLRFNQIIQLI
jgi:hypothetical protein